MADSSFKAAWWLRNPHLQTLWPVIMRREVRGLAIRRERVNMPDGDFIDLDWVDSADQDSPLVIVLHGFEGSIESHYAQGILKKIQDIGWRAVFMHFRGCSGVPNRLARGYHSGETTDVAYIVKMMRERFADAPLAAIGYSLGGNVLLKWLGETGEHNPLSAAIAISVPFELHKAAARIQTGFSRFYQWYFLKCLRQRLTDKYDYVADAPVHPTTLEIVNKISEFDDIYTAPLHGFKNVDDYYTRSSSRQYLHSIKVPTLILHAKDDPFMVEDVIPGVQELSSQVTLEVTDTGGHVGFVSGRLPWRPVYWLEQRIPLFLQDTLNNR